MDLIGKKILESAEAIEKSIHELKAEFVYLCVWERKKKIDSFEITVIIFLWHTLIFL